MPVSNLERAIATILTIEAIGIFVLAAWEVVALVSGDTGDAVSSVALIVLTTVGAVAQVAFAIAVWRGASWGRSGGIVTQLLILAVALGTISGDEPRVGVAIGLAALAVPCFVLLLAAVRRAGRWAAAADAAHDAPGSAG